MRSSLSLAQKLGREVRYVGRVDGDLRAYTLATAGLLGIELAPEEVDDVVGQVERVAGLVDKLPHLEDDSLTMAPRFEP